LIDSERPSTSGSPRPDPGDLAARPSGSPAIEGTGRFGAGLTAFVHEREERVVEIDRPAHPGDGTTAIPTRPTPRRPGSPVSQRERERRDGLERDWTLLRCRCKFDLDHMHRACLGARTSAALAAFLTVAAGLLLGAAAQAAPSTAGAHLVIRLQGTVENPTQTLAAGTFAASGGFVDTGKFTVHRNPTTFRDRWSLSGKHGTISVAAFLAKWSIISGTGSYAHLRGNGTLTETSGNTGAFRQTWTGTVTR
jgi:hypothetical protein